MPKVMAWADGSLPRLHHYRARSRAWIGLMISKVGRCQEALTPTEEALKITLKLAKSNLAFLPNLAGCLNNSSSLQLQLGQPEIAGRAYEESIAILKMVGPPTDKPPWTVATLPVWKSTERQLDLMGSSSLALPDLLC